MSTLVLMPSGLTERHDALLSMLFTWSTTEAIAVASLKAGLSNKRGLLNAARMARSTGQGQPGREYLDETGCAALLLSFFLQSRTVRRAIAKHLSKHGEMRKGAAMMGLSQLTAQLRELMPSEVAGHA